MPSGESGEQDDGRDHDGRHPERLAIFDGDAEQGHDSDVRRRCANNQQGNEKDRFHYRSSVEKG